MSKGILAGAVLGALVGASVYSTMNAKTKKKLKKEVSSKYNQVRGQVDDFIHSIEKKVSKNVQKKAEEWSDKAKDTLGSIKEQIDSMDFTEHKELGFGLLLGAALGVGGTYLLNHYSLDEEEHENIFQRCHRFLDFGSTDDSGNSKIEDIIHLALAGLRMWHKIRE